MQQAVSVQRIAAIDTLRGVAMALMLVDHVREFFYLHQQVSDPMSLDTTSPALFFTRLASHFCAPIFIFLTGLGAWCHGQKLTTQPVDFRPTLSAYLVKRGLLLIGLELTLINFAWTFALPPKMIYLQVIWAIGLAMLALAALLWLPRLGQITLGALIIAGHHLLDGVHFHPDQLAYPFWAILHDRSLVELAADLKARTSYPVLPWIGVILLGYAAGPLYGRDITPKQRQDWLTWAGISAVVLFALLRWFDAYGDHPRMAATTLLGQVMSWLNVTKYPPSLLFLLLTLGLGMIILSQLEKCRPWPLFTHLGTAPMFFYILHLYLLHGLYLFMINTFGVTQGQRYGFNNVWQIWWVAGLLLPAFAPLCRRFSAYKRQHPNGWTSYF